MDIYDRFEHDGLTITAYYDTEYQTRGSYAYDTEEETEQAENEEISKLESGEWVVLYATVSSPCPCGECGHARITGSLGGIVIENDQETVRAHLLDCLYMGQAES